MSTTSQITLNFFGETVSVANPSSISALRNNIATLFCFSPEDAKEILLTYNDNGDKIVIENDEDLKAFLNTKINTIDLDISQTSQLYQKNLDTIKQENEKDKLALENLLKRQEELDQLKETKYGKEKEEIQKIKEQIMNLRKRKLELRLRMMKGIKKLNSEKKENEKKIVELQKKLGLPINKPKHNPKDKIKKPIAMKHGPCPYRMPPFIFPYWNAKPYVPGFPMRPHLKRNMFNFPQGKKNEMNNTFEDWGKCLFNKTQEITNALAETFKDIPIFNIPFKGSEEKKEKKKEEKKEEKEIHNFVKCDGCGMYPLIGKRNKCKTCPNFDYCEKCLEKNKETHKHEFMVVPPMKRPGHIHNKIKKLEKKEKIKKKLEKKVGKKLEKKEKKLEKCKTDANILEEKEAKEEKVEKEVEEEKEENKIEIKNEDNNNLKDKLVHFGVTCDGCGVFPIIGCRYKCAVCNDFDFCEDCEKKLGEEHNHPFLKIYEPKMTPVSFKCIENNQ